MNKTKIGVAVLLLGLSLGPVQTSQNYSIRLNNLAYAEESADQPSTDGGSAQNGPTTPSTGIETTDNPGAQTGTEKEVPKESSESESLETSENVVSQAVGLSKLDDELEKAKKELLDQINEYETKLGNGNTLKAAINEEIENHDNAHKAYVDQIEKATSKEDLDGLSKLREDYYKAAARLGYRVYSARDARISLRKEIEKANKILAIKDDESLKELVAKSLLLFDNIKSEAKDLADKSDEIKKASNELAAKEKIKEEKIALTKEEEKAIEDTKGFPNAIFDELKDKDVFDYKLEALIDMDKDAMTDFTEEKLQKVKGRNIKKEVELIKKFGDAKAKLQDLIFSDETGSVSVAKAQEEYDEAAVEAKKVVNDDKVDKLADRAAALKEADEDFRKSDNYKKLKEAKDLAIEDYEKAFDALKDAAPTDSNYEKLIEAVEAAKKVIEEGKGRGTKEAEELDKKVNEALNDKFKESDKYKRATKDLQKAYDTAYDALKDKKGQTELDQVAKAKKDIENYYDEFNTKYDALEKYIDQAKSDKLNDDSLKKLKEEYKKKLEGYKTDFSKKVTDIDALEKEFNEKLNSADTNKKTTKKVVTSKKTAGGKVRTGVEAVLPIAGGVLVVAAIALVLTRKKNK